MLPEDIVVRVIYSAVTKLAGESNIEVPAYDINCVDWEVCDSVPLPAPLLSRDLEVIISANGVHVSIYVGTLFHNAIAYSYFIAKDLVQDIAIVCNKSRFDAAKYTKDEIMVTHAVLGIFSTLKRI